MTGKTFPLLASLENTFPLPSSFSFVQLCNHLLKFIRRGGVCVCQGIEVEIVRCNFDPLIVVEAVAVLKGHEQLAFLNNLLPASLPPQIICPALPICHRGANILVLGQ